MKIHIFNPENDLALADGHPGYTAPASARQMRSDLSWFPKWWAQDEDEVWDGLSSLSLHPGDEICPWGWSPALKHQLQQAGVEEAFLPSDEELSCLRSLSHRGTAVQALDLMRGRGLLGEALCGHSVLCHTVDEVMAQVNRWPKALLKAPWSGSGKGLRQSTAPDLENWSVNTLRQQGSVVVEEWLDKACDFALEFWLDGKGGVEYRGLSLFFTNDNGMYMGNWLAPEVQKFQWLMQYVSPQLLMDIRQWWTDNLVQLATSDTSAYRYRGPVGIDMMLCRTGGICPCIEINWRMTMGMVAALLTEQGRRGKLVVEYVYGQYSADIVALV